MHNKSNISVRYINNKGVYDLSYEKEMRILFVSMLFQPDNRIGSVRVSNFARWLGEYGHTVDVICENQEAVNVHLKNLKVHYVHNSKMYVSLQQKIYSKSANVKSNHNKNEMKLTDSKKKSKFKFARSLLFEWLKGADWFFKSKELINKDLKSNNYDVIVASYGPIGSLWLGYWIKNKGYASKWVLDIRDLPYDEEWPMWINKVYKVVNKRLLNKADMITVISNGVIQKLKNEWITKKTNVKRIELINNGFELNSNTEKQSIFENHNLNLCYTGTMYGGKRNLTIIFEALSQLVNEKSILIDDINFYYAGSDYSILKQMAERFKMERILINKGSISRSEAIKLQENCDILIVATWNTIEEKGILSGKFFEYLGANKPIISIVDGNVPNAEISEFINEMKLGFSFEYIKRTTDFVELKKYLVECYHEKKQKGYIQHKPDYLLVNKFRYDKLTKKLESLIVDIFQERGL